MLSAGMGTPKYVGIPGPNQVGFLSGQGINSFSYRPNNNEDIVVGNQKKSLLCMHDVGPFACVGQNIEYVFAMIESESKQIIPNMGWICGSGLTSANVPQTSLAINSGATIHRFSNEDLLHSVKATKETNIHCGGSTFDYAMVGHICNKLKHLPLPKGKICIAKDRIANMLSIGKLVKEGYRVTMDSDVENVIHVYNDNGSYIKFVCVQNNLYCVNLDSSGEYTNFLTTVVDQKNHFSDIDNKKAALVRYIQECHYLKLLTMMKKSLFSTWKSNLSNNQSQKSQKSHHHQTEDRQQFRNWITI